ncbi:glycosyltransferase [Streptomyces sp. XH2]|uniref:glycosyltransferase n=1 Tax=Streptomyces sp. XH2 TaxID=3412483 RepID=UPI003C7BFE89
MVRDFRPARDQVSRYVLNAGRQLVRDGHRVHLLSATGDFGEAERHGLRPVPLATRPEEEKYTYFTPAHAHADRIYETLRALAAESGLDAVEFPDRDGEGLTTIRAKRLLGEFPDTALTVRAHAPAALTGPLSGARPGDTDRAMAAYAEEYCIRHADLVLLPSRRVAAYARSLNGKCRYSPCPLAPSDLLTGPPSGGRSRQVTFAGPVGTLGGADVFLTAAARLAVSDPDVTFTLFGRKAGRPGAGLLGDRRLDRLVSGPLRGRVTFLDPADVPDRAGLWRNTRLCVVPARWDNRPYEALEAMSHGCPVVCASGGGTAELVTDGVSGFVTPVGDPDALARLLTRLTGADAHLLDETARLGSAAARARSDPVTAARLLADAYREARPGLREGRTDDTPVVSVVISVYNKGRWLAGTLASVRAQTHPRTEIVVVNDGSTDPATRAAFDALTGVVKVDKPNGGPGSAYNAGIAAASGEFVLPLDGDDLLEPDCVATALEALRRAPELGHVTCYVKHFGLVNAMDAPLGTVPALMPFLNTGGKRTRLLRRSALDAVGGYDERLPTLDDVELLIRLERAGRNGDIVPRALFSYRRHPASLTFASPGEQFVDEHQYILAKHADLLAAQGPAACHHLLHLWKNSIEFSPSARWRRARKEGPPCPE